MFLSSFLYVLTDLTVDILLFIILSFFASTIVTGYIYIPIVMEFEMMYARDCRLEDVGEIFISNARIKVSTPNPIGLHQINMFYLG